MIDFLLIQRFLLALALGAFMGLEREYARYNRRGEVHAYAGIRTFPLISLFGALAAYLGDIISLWILLISLFLLGILVVVAYYTISRKSNADAGATSEIAGFIAFFIGIMTYYGELSFAVALTIVVTLILYARSSLHGFAQKITAKEMQSTVIFAVIAFVILPFLPNSWFGPFATFNPYFLWLIVVFISAISFSGYVLMKWFGERGIALAGIFGGLASSTATTLNFAERSKKVLNSSHAFALAVILANGVMFIRVLFEISVVHPSLVSSLILPFVVLAAVTLLISFFLWRKVKKVKEKVQLSSPLSLFSALKLAIFFALILAVLKITSVYFSSAGVYVISLLSGALDADAAAVSLAQLAKTSLDREIAQKGILLAMLMNMVFKGGLAYWIGGKEFRKVVLGSFAVLLIVGLVLVFFV
ncbi:MgtC/SapB family protein [Candidatus Woesearchaeota archaeon]|nr:MgtC/SapB family protein [Candidatus Woesearchaeota archaeon]